MPSAPVRLTLGAVRKLAITKQHLAGKPPRNPGPAAIMALMRDVRYLQIDPTSVVAPSQYLVLWSRLGRYKPTDLDRLLWKDRKLLESWSHAASIVLTEDYPLYKARGDGWVESWRGSVWYDRLINFMRANKELKEHILEELRVRGPLSAKEFEDRSRVGWGTKGSGWKSHGWYKGSRRSVSRMVEFLSHQGAIMVAERDGKQKLWDLTEKVVPKWAPRNRLSETDVEYDAVQKSLKALGSATPKQVASHFLAGVLGRYPRVKAAIGTLESDGRVLPVTIDGVRGRDPWFMHSDDLKLLQRLEGREGETRTTLLSPFDNLIIDRERTELLFDYLFRLEIYTPKPQRKNGFFVLSILDGDRIIGRLDPALDREREALVVNSMHAEPGAPEGQAPGRRIGEAIEDLAAFVGAKRVVYPRSIPEPWAGHLGQGTS